MSTKSSIDVSIVIPCYRSGRWLPELVERIIAAMDGLDLAYEIVLVNDASPDGTWNAIEQLVAEYPCVRGFDMLFNVGQFRATLCGLEHARGELIVTMDDDLQHPPEEIATLLEAIRARPEVDCVIGAYRRKRHGPIRRLGSRVMAHLNEAFYGKPRDLTITSFRVLRRQVAQAVCAHGTAKPIISPLLLRSTRRIVNVQVDHCPRPKGRSGYSLPRLVQITLDNLIGASTLPLKAVSLLGLASAAGSVVLGLVYLFRYLTGAIGVPGFVTQVLLITFFGGMTLLSVGILGEYVLRIIHEVARPPRYIVRHRAEMTARANSEGADGGAIHDAEHCGNQNQFDPKTSREHEGPPCSKARGTP